MASLALCSCGGSAGVDDRELAASLVTIEVANESSSALYLQQESWLSLAKEGVSFAHEKSCAVCECGETSCAVCGMGLPMVIGIDPGQSHTATWRGLEWIYRDDCVESRVVPSGTSLTATVTYAASFEPSEYGGETIVDPASVAVDFLHPPPDGRVRVELAAIP